MTRQKAIVRAISIVVSIAFLFTNCVSAGELAVSHKMAAHSQLKEIEPVAAVQYVNQAVLDTLIRNSATTNQDIREKGADIDRELQEAVKGIDEGKYLYGVLRNREKPGECALYVVYPYLTEGGRIVVHRYSKQGEPEDPLYSKYLKDHTKQSEPVQAGNQAFNHEVILVPPELNEYILSLQFPGESPRGLAKSLSYDNGPVTQEETAEVEKIIADFERREEIKPVYDGDNVLLIRDHLLAEEYTQLAGKVELRYVPDMVIKINGKTRIFPAYSKNAGTPTEPKWITYISKNFISKMEELHATGAVDMLFSHEFNEITTGDHNEAERRELAARKITIEGKEMSYLDAFIYYVYADELGCKRAQWWPALQRWVVFEKLRLIVNAGRNNKAIDLEKIKGEIFSLEDGFSELEKIKIELPEKEQGNLWEYTIDVCKSLQNFLEGNRKYYDPEVGKTNFNRFGEYASSITNDPDIRELLWLTTIFFQIGKTEDSKLGNYYLKGKEIFRGLLGEYYKNTGKTPEEIERLVKLGSELIYRFGDIRALYMGHIPPDTLLKIENIEGLSGSDRELLLKLINVFTFVYTHHHTLKRLSDAVVNFILDYTASIEIIKKQIEEKDWFGKRLDVWFDQEHKALFLGVFYDIVPEGDRSNLEAFIRNINLFNTYRTFRLLSGKMKAAKNPRFYAETMVKMLYFFMKLNQYAQKDWIIFAQDRHFAEDMITRFGYKTIENINEIFKLEGEGYIKPNFQAGKRVILSGIPFYIDGNRLIMDLCRYGEGVDHGIRLLSRRDEVGYYDLVVVVTEEFSEAEMVQLVKDGKNNGSIPENAKVIVVSQPDAGDYKIGGNWSAIINLRCNPKLKVDVDRLEREGIQLVKVGGIEKGEELGSYIQGKNVAVILSAGTAARAYPLACHGDRDKGKQVSVNGIPYLLQVFRQIMYYYIPGHKGMVITSNDGIKCPSQDMVLGKQHFQVIGAAKPTLDEIGNYREREVGQLGCMVVDVTGKVLKFVERPTFEEWKTKLEAIPIVPTNWADYCLSEEFLNYLAEVYGTLMTTDNETNIYLRYGLDTSKDFTEIATGKYEEIAKEKNESDEYKKAGIVTTGEKEYALARKDWKYEDAVKIYRAVRGLSSKIGGVGFVDAGQEAYFKDTGANENFMTLAQELLKNNKLRELLGVTKENGYRLVKDPEGKKIIGIIGPNVRLHRDVDVELGKNYVIVGDVTIRRGKIGDGCVIIDSIVETIDIANSTLVYGVYRPQEKLVVESKGERKIVPQVVTDVFLDKSKISPNRQQKLLLKTVRFPNGEEAIRLTILLPIEEKANDKIYRYIVDIEGEEIVVYVREGKIVSKDIDYLIDVSVEEKGGMLTYIGKDDEKRILGKIVSEKSDGGSVWGFRIWPRHPSRDGRFIRLSERGDNSKLSFDDIKKYLRKEAIRAFKYVLSNPDQELFIDESDLQFPLSKAASEARERIAKNILAFDRVSIYDMSPQKGVETNVPIGVKAVDVTVNVDLGDIPPEMVEVKIWYGMPGGEWLEEIMKLEKVIESTGKYLYKGSIPVTSSGVISFTTKVSLKGTDKVVWHSKPGDDGLLLIRQTAAVAGPIARKARAGEGTVPLWQADLKEDGQIDETKVTVIIPAHTKIPKLDLDKYGKVRERLIKRYGLGIYGAISGVRVVDNLVMGEGEDVAPYAVVREIDGRKYILIDIDAFSLEVEQLYIEIEHSLKHSILELITDNKVLEELTAIYMSLEEAMEIGVSAPSNLDELGMDSRFWELLSGLKKVEAEKRTPAVIISYAIECLRRIPYYREIFNRLGLDEAQWIDAVGQAEQKTLAAIDVYTQLTGNDRTELVEGVRKIKGQEKETRARLTNVAGIQVPESIAKAAKKIKMLSSSIPVRQMGFVDRLFSKGKYIRLYVEDLRTNPYIVEWLQDLLKGKDKSPFIICSREEEPEKAQSVIDQFLSENKLIQAQAPAGIDTKDIIDTSDLSCVLGKELPKNCLSLPLIFSVSSIYLAGEVVLADGSIDQLKERDPLVYNTLMTMYATLFGDGFTSDMLKQIIFGEWPKDLRVAENVESLRITIAEIEKAA